jgi:hypothetical protein
VQPTAHAIPCACRGTSTSRPGATRSRKPLPLMSPEKRYPPRPSLQAQKRLSPHRQDKKSRRALHRPANLDSLLHSLWLYPLPRYRQVQLPVMLHPRDTDQRPQLDNARQWRQRDLRSA